MFTKSSPASTVTPPLKLTFGDGINLALALGIIGMVIHFAAEYFLSDQAVSHLEADVRAVNEAVYLFRVSGGDLSGAHTPEQVIAMMQSVEEDSLALKIHSILDTAGRHAVFQSSAESLRRAERAYWDADRQRFRVAEEGPRGIKDFRGGAKSAKDPAR